MKATECCVKKIALCALLLAVSACGNNFEDFNSWYGDAAYVGHSQDDMRAAKEEIARLRAQKQRYADVQTVPSRQQAYQQKPVAVQQPAAQPRPVYYKRDERSDAGTVNNGPLFPASVNRSPDLASIYRTAKAPTSSASMWDRLWPSAR